MSQNLSSQLTTMLSISSTCFLHREVHHYELHNFFMSDQILICLTISIISGHFVLVSEKVTMSTGVVTNYELSKLERISVVSSPDPAPEEGKGLDLVHIECFLGTQDAAGHVIVVTTHCFGMATHQWLSSAATVGYSAVSHGITCKPHGMNLILARRCLETSPRKRSMCTGPSPPLWQLVWGRD